MCRGASVRECVWMCVCVHVTVGVGWEGGACASWLLRVLIYECMRTADKESDLIVLKLDLS